MNHKILWKIQSLWEQHYRPNKQGDFSVENNYQSGNSRYYSPFHLVDEFSFEPSAKPVFTDEYGEYLGLKNLQVTQKDGKYWYLFDNHNEIIYPLTELYEAIKQPLTIVHIDAHRDDATFEGQKPNNLSLPEVGEYITSTRISDFFDALSETKIVQEVIRVTNSEEFNAFEVPKVSYIVSLDIDIFGEEGAFTNLETKVEVIAKACSGAQAVCIATSPGFIDPDFAHTIISIFSKPVD